MAGCVSSPCEAVETQRDFVRFLTSIFYMQITAYLKTYRLLKSSHLAVLLKQISVWIGM